MAGHIVTKFRFACFLSAMLAVCVVLPEAHGAEYFVAPDGSDGDVGTGWDSAFATISNALAQAGVTTVTVSNGTYELTDTIAIPNAVTIRSFGGGVYGGLVNASNTVVRRPGGTSGSLFRIFLITHTNAVLDGLTVTGGMGTSQAGRGIHMTGGTVQNCIIRDNGDLYTQAAAKTGGGGIYMNGGVVSNCTVQGNAVLEDSGVGIWARSNSRILHCRVLDNKQMTSHRTTYGAGIYANGANILIRNCLVAGNVGKDHGAGIYGGTVENCTVVRNQAWRSISLGGGVYNAAVVNSVVMDNTTGSGSDLNYGGSCSFSHSCASPLPPGDGNIERAGFVDAANTNYQLTASAAVDGGTNAAWMVTALDLVGNPRLNGPGTIVDMGGYEKVPGALECGFAADVTSILAGSNVVFTAAPSGTNTALTAASWVFGDGHVGEGVVVTNTYGSPGAYTVSLAITNDVGESASASYTNYITVWGSRAYVATNSPAPTEPYHTWSNAAHSLKGVVDAVPAGATVVLSNGTHEIPSQLLLDRGLTMTSYGSGMYGGLENAATTVIKRPSSNPNHRVMQITDSRVVLDGLPIAGGRGRGTPGMGVHMTGGTLINCIVRDNGDTSTTHAGVADAGGIWMNGGTVSNCVVRDNVIPEGNGVGIRAQGSARILNSRILDNTKVAHYPRSGGGIYAASSSVLIRNCLVARNVTWTSGGGIYGGRIENCTVVSNTVTLAGGEAGGVYLSSGSTVSNSIVYFNEVSGVHTNLNTTTGVGFSCFTIPDSGTNGNISADPLFVDLAGGDYRLSDASPCINRGDSSIVTWSTDLDGNRRVAGSAVDIGAYEFQPPAGSILIVR